MNVKEVEITRGVKITIEEPVCAKALRSANEFYKRFEMANLLTDKGEIFKAYFASYLVAKENGKSKWQADHSISGIKLNFPGTGKPILEDLHRSNLIAERSATLLKIIAKGIEDIGKETSEKKCHFTSQQIESMANFMTTAFVEHKQHKNTFEDLKQAIEEIKKTYKAVKD